MASTRGTGQHGGRKTARETGLAAHARRVAALALEIGAHLKLGRAEQELLKAASLFHHDNHESFSGEGLDRVILEARLAGLARSGAAAPISGPEDIEKLRAALWRPRAGADSGLRRLASIVEVADFFDERLEFLPYERLSGEQIVGEMAQLAGAGILAAESVRAFTGLPRIPLPELLRIGDSLKAHPKVALKIMELAADEDVQFPELEKLVSADPVLAGRIVSAANSSLYARSGKLVGIRQCISHLGLQKTRQICCAHAFAPLFASSRLHALWKHSLELAQVAETMASASGACDPEVAFLAGLVHDIGRLVLEMTGGPAAHTFRTLIECGCEPFFAEMVVCERDHGDIGARVLGAWGFPAGITAAVAAHHCPEEVDLPLASLLYLAEYWSASEEDYPSSGRLSAALSATGLSMQTVNQPAPSGGLSSVFAAA